MGDLFSEAAGRRLESVAPLPARLRPRTLEEFLGQTHVVGPGSALRLAIEATSALLSRCQLYTLESQSDEDLEALVRRGAGTLQVEAPDEVVAEIARRAGGDARSALATLELAWQTARAERTAMTVRHVEDAAQKRPLRY